MNRMKIIAIGHKSTALMVLIGLALMAAFCGQGGEEDRCGGFYSDKRTSEITHHFSDSAQVAFAVIGDYGDDSLAEARVAALVNSLSPDLIITAGDNNYPAGSFETVDRNIGKHYGSYIHPYRGAYGGGRSSPNRFFPAIGNHDWPPLAHVEYFELPGNERYYDFTWGPVHFFALSTYECEPEGVSAGSRQALWLKDKLASSKSPFRFVYGHHPPYSSGTHGSIKEMRWPFRQWGADAYLAGHDHTYERLLVGGMPYFVVGLGGKSIYPFGRALPESVFRYNADYGALLVTVEEGRALFRFHDIKGSVIDEFEIVKQ